MHEILILDDDEKWLAMHVLRLQKAGFECHSTKLADEAIKYAKEKAGVKLAIIDEILKLPACDGGGMQDLQGNDVARKISGLRPDIQIVMITAKPLDHSGGNALEMLKIADELRTPGIVHDVLHKPSFEANPDRAYQLLIDLLQWLAETAPQFKGRGTVLVSYGLAADLIDEFVGPRKPIVLLKELLQKAELQNVDTKGLIEKTSDKDKAVFIHHSSRRRAAVCPGIKPGTQLFRILEKLAWDSETDKTVEIHESDYEPSHSGSRSQGVDAERLEIRRGMAGVDQGVLADDDSTDADASVARQQRSVGEDFMWGNPESEDERDVHSIGPGSQMTGRSTKKQSILKTPISRLRKSLRDAGVTSKEDPVFEETGHRAYRPTFQLGIAFFRVE